MRRTLHSFGYEDKFLRKRNVNIKNVKLKDDSNIHIYLLTLLESCVLSTWKWIRESERVVRQMIEVFIFTFLCLTTMTRIKLLLHYKENFSLIKEVNDLITKDFT